MNKDRRANIEKARKLLDEARGGMEAALTLLEDAASEEREYYDNMHENLRDGDKGTRADEAASALDNAVEMIQIDFDELESYLDTAVE